MSLKLESELGIQIQPDGNEFLREELKEVSDRGVRNCLLNSDFRKLPEGAFHSCDIVNASKDTLILVQLSKVVDVSRPLGPEGDSESTDESDEPEEVVTQTVKSGRNSNKRLLRLSVVSITGNKFDLMELHRVPSLSDSLVPGTKLLLRGRFKQAVTGMYVIEYPEQISVLGGRVEKLAQSFDQNIKAKERGVLGGDKLTTDGPPKFVSFMDRHKVKPLTNSTKPSAVTESKLPAASVVAEVRPVLPVLPTATVKPDEDAFAFRGKGKGKSVNRFERRKSRYEEDEIMAQYKPPSRSAPQMAAFVRLDKNTVVDAASLFQREEPTEDSQPKYFARRNDTHASGDRGKGKGKGKGKGERRDR